MRCAGPTERSGFVYAVAPTPGASARIAAVPEALLRARDPNPRGGTRGARGIALGDGEIFVANFDTVHRYDSRWTLKHRISHPLCADIHDIALHDGALWVASTRNDRLLQFDMDGRLIDALDPWCSGVVEEMFGIRRTGVDQPVDFRDPRSHESRATDRLHLNSFAFLPSGDRLLSFGQVRVNGHCESALIRVRANGGTDLVHRLPSVEVPSHNIALLPDGRILHARTGNGEVQIIGAEGSGPSRVTPAGATNSPSETVLRTRAGYIRGLCPIDNATVAVGIQNEVWIVDVHARRRVTRIKLSEDLRESVHSIVLDGP